MPDRILTAEAAQRLQDESTRAGEQLTWLVMVSEDSAKLIARPVSSGRGALPCVLVAATLPEIHTQLPAGLKRSDRPADQPDVVESWYSAAPRRNYRR